MTERKILARLVEYAPRVLGDFAKPGPRCVLASRVGLEVLARLDIPADCAPVIIDVANQAFLQWVADGQPGGRDEYLARGCWLVTNNPAPMGGALTYEGVPIEGRARWPGHLIVTARDRLIDLDVQQTARPRHDISPPGGLAVQWDGLGAAADFRWGCVRYRPWPPSAPLPDFRHSKDWRAPVDHITAPILRAIRKGTL